MMKGYTVTVSIDCQSVEGSITILLDKACGNEVYIPNIFSPNDDGVNDEFSISFSDLTNVESVTCSIFDRWGNQVFRSAEFSFKWDGTYKSQPLQSGVYVYVIQVESNRNDKSIMKNYSGDITIMR